MKYTIEEIGWVEASETQEQTLGGMSSVPTTMYGVNEEQVGELLEQLMFATPIDCIGPSGVQSVQRKITVSVEIEDV